jgi:hypothetical protein
MRHLRNAGTATVIIAGQIKLDSCPPQPDRVPKPEPGSASLRRPLPPARSRTDFESATRAFNSRLLPW